MIRAVTLLGFALLAGAMVAVQIYSLRTRRVLTVGEIAGVLVRHPGGRLVLMAAWLWLGWHFFARVEI